MKIQAVDVKKISGKLDSVPAVPYGLSDSSDDIIKWGVDNGTPFRINQVVRRSLIGAACYYKTVQFTFGQGIANKELANLQINESQTLNDLALDLIQRLCQFEGFGINTQYNRAGQTAKLYNLPFESSRLSLPEEGKVNDIIYNPYFGLNNKNRVKNCKYPFYSLDNLRDDVRRLRDDFRGQVLYYSNTDIYNFYYPNPHYWSDNMGNGNGKSAMENDYLLSQLLNSELDHGFMNNVILKVIGDPDQPIPEHQHLRDEGKGYTTMGQRFSEHINNTLSGVDGDKMFIAWALNSEEFPELEAFPTNLSYDKLSSVKDIVKEDVISAWGVPAVLLDRKTTGNISQDDQKTAVSILQNNVLHKQKIVSRAIEKVLENWHEPIEDITVSFIPFQNIASPPAAEIWGVMTVEEKRKWIMENTDIELDGNSQITEDE